MGNCFSKSAASHEDSPVPLYRSKRLFNFKKKMLKTEEFTFDEDSLVVKHMTEGVRQNFGELYAGRRQFPPPADWVERFYGIWRPYCESNAPWCVRSRLKK